MSQHIGNGVNWIYDRLRSLGTIPAHFTQLRRTSNSRNTSRRSRSSRSNSRSAHSTTITSSSSSPSSTSSPSSRSNRIPPPHSHRHSYWSNHPIFFGSHRGHRRLRSSQSIEGNHQDKDRNILAAMMSIIVIATLATALAQPKWFSIKGGVCNRKYIGLQEFFYVGSFNEKSSNIEYRDNHEKGRNQVVFSRIPVPDVGTGDSKNQPKGTIKLTSPSQDIIYYGMNGDLKNCVTPEIVSSQRTIIALCFFAIMFNLIQFFMDTMGTSKKWANTMRQHAIGNILGVLLCVIIIGVSYLVSNLMEKEQMRIAKSHSNQSPHIEVKFELSYYLVTLSGLLAIVASACNLLKKPNYHIDSNALFWNDDLEINTPLDDDISSSSPTLSSPLWQPLPSHSLPLPIPSPQSSMPPPPPYVP